MPANIEAFNVYMQVKNQHIMGFSGPVDLNFLSVKFIMDMMGVKDQLNVFERVHTTYTAVLDHMRDKANIEGE